MGLELKALWSDLVDKKLGDCTTAVVKDDAQEVTEKVVMTNLWSLKKQASQTCQTICKSYFVQINMF